MHLAMAHVAEQQVQRSCLGDAASEDADNLAELIPSLPVEKRFLLPFAGSQRRQYQGPGGSPPPLRGQAHGRLPCELPQVQHHVALGARLRHRAPRTAPPTRRPAATTRCAAKARTPASCPSRRSFSTRTTSREASSSPACPRASSSPTSRCPCCRSASPATAPGAGSCTSVGTPRTPTSRCPCCRSASPATAPGAGSCTSAGTPRTWPSPGGGPCARPSRTLRRLGSTRSSICSARAATAGALTGATPSSIGRRAGEGHTRCCSSGTRRCCKTRRGISGGWRSSWGARSPRQRRRPASWTPS
ncbi:hypothetical protein ACQJBY_004006 [Aegilops geniculata]